MEQQSPAAVDHENSLRHGRGAYFDGISAVRRDVRLVLHADKLEIIDAALPSEAVHQRILAVWPLGDLRVLEKPGKGAELRVACADASARLSIAAGGLSATLAARRLRTLPKKRAGNGFRALFIAIAVIGGLIFSGYAAMRWLPEQAVSLVPESWWQALAAPVERQMLGEDGLCRDPEGQEALARLVVRLTQPYPGEEWTGPAAVSGPDIAVFNSDEINAFTLPGGRILLTRGLIDQATSSREVAAVIAHELGHVVYRHPEQQFLRIIGFESLGVLLSGGTSAGEFGAAAGLLMLLGYSRDAERQADGYAVGLLKDSGVGVQGLRSFFQKLHDRENKARKGTGAKITEKSLAFFSTHPGMTERLAAIAEDADLPAIRDPAERLITASQWRALRRICDGPTGAE